MFVRVPHQPLWLEHSSNTWNEPSAPIRALICILMYCSARLSKPFTTQGGRSRPCPRNGSCAYSLQLTRANLSFRYRRLQLLARLPIRCVLTAYLATWTRRVPVATWPCIELFGFSRVERVYNLSSGGHNYSFGRALRTILSSPSQGSCAHLM